MKVNATNFLFGIFLIILGVFFILGTAFDFRLDEAYVVALVFGAIGIVLLLAYFVFKNKIWSLITGAGALFIAAAIVISESNILPEESIGALLFLLIGLAFLTALRQGKRNWWAIIPAGFSFMFAVHILIDMNWWDMQRYHGVVFFAGVGLIFGVLYLIRDSQYRLEWAKYPSIIAFIFAVIVFLTVDAGDFMSRLILPLILMGIGALIISRALRETEIRQAEEDKPKPPQKKPPTRRAVPKK